MSSTVLVIEPRLTGHFIAYSKMYCDALSGRFNVVMANTTRAKENSNWQNYLGSSDSTINMEFNLQPFDWSRPRRAWAKAIQASSNLIDKYDPDVVLVHSSEGLEYTLSNPLSNLAFKRKTKNKVFMLGLPLTTDVKPFKKWLADQQRSKLNNANFITNHPPFYFRHKERLENWHLVPEPVLDEFQRTSKTEARSRLQLSPNGPLCLIAGMLENRTKGTRKFIEEFSKVDVRDQTELLIAGTIKETTRDWIRHTLRHCLDRVHFFSYKNEKQLADCISAADLVVLPYPNHKMTSAIGARAIAMCRPIFAPRIEWFEETIEKTGCGFFFSDSKTLACAPELAEVAALACDYSPNKSNLLFNEYASLNNFSRTITKIIFNTLKPSSNVDVNPITWHDLD